LHHQSISSNPHGKNDFAEIFKNLARYRSDNNFVELNIKIIMCKTFKLVARILNFFTALLEFPTPIIILMVQQSFQICI